jgi:ubiquitin carboxyl-terminal hydrolase 14
VRFYWKQESVTSGTEGGKAKILRSVSFPNRFDVFEFCSAELKKSLDLGREFERKQREAEDNKALNNKGADVEMKDETKKEETKEEKPQLVGKAAKAAVKSERIKKEDEALYRPHG